MATGTKRPTKAAAKPKPAPAPEPEELDEVQDEGTDELDELDEVEETDEVEEAPAKSAKKGKAKADKPKVEKPAFGTNELAKHVSEQSGKSFDGKGIRVLLRKLARDGKLDRTVGEDRSRYSFTGPDDPRVKQIIEAVKSGEAEKAKQEGIAKAKASKAAKKSPKTEEAEVAGEEVEVEAEDIEDLDDDADE